MNTTIELTTEVAKKMMWARLKPFDFAHMPFEDFTIEFPYEVFQTKDELVEYFIKTFGGADRILQKSEHDNLLKLAEQSLQQKVLLNVRRDNDKCYIKLTMDVDTLYYGYFIIEPICLPVPHTILNTGHSNPTQYGLMLFSVAIRTMDFLNSPKIIKESTREKVDRITGKRVYTSNKKKYVYNTRYVFKNAHEQLEKRTFNYHVAEWEQRGHYRTYKDGKKVWIKPCKKARKNINTDIKSEKNIYRITKIER